MAILLDGKAQSALCMEELKTRVAALKNRGVVPGLAVILVGDDPASQIYVRNKGLACQALGLYEQTVLLPADITQDALEKRIDELNADEKIDGILLQLPLPKGLDEKAALDRIGWKKDADGFHILNAGRLFTGREGVLPCTPKGILTLLKAYQVPLAGQNAVVVGRSNIVGKPTAMLLLSENCTVTLCHSRTKDLKAHCQNADILVAAVGKPRFITADMVKPGAAVVDVGVNRADGKVVGDVDFEAVAPIAGFISPVPGGVGKMTVAMLMDNVVSLAEQRAKG